MLRKPDEDLFENSKMSFGEHLEELRSTLWRAILALAIGVGIGFLPPVGGWVVRFVKSPVERGLVSFEKKRAKEDFERYLKEREAAGDKMVGRQRDLAKEYASRGLIPDVYRVDPLELQRLAGGEAIEATPQQQANPEDALVPLTLYRPPKTSVIGTNVTDGFMVYVKAALLVGAVLASPAVFYFLWNFVASGLYQHERKYVYIFLPFSIALFVLGAGVAFFLAIGFVLDFLFGFFGWLGIDPTPRISEWLSFVLLLPLGFGIAFQLPLVMLFLERIGVFTVAAYISYWRIAILVIFVLSMVLTPSDPGSMLLLAIPLTGLYFGGAALCRYMPRRQTPFGEPID